MNRIVNCTVISNFAAIGRLDVLRDVTAPLAMPMDVYQEIRAGQLAGYVFYDAIERHIAPFTDDGWLHLVTMTPEELQCTTILPGHLHAGERACLCIARQRAWGFLSDDWAARQQARLWQIPLSGTLGVLLLAIQDQRLTVETANTLLTAMIRQAHYRSPVVDLATLLP